MRTAVLGLLIGAGLVVAAGFGLHRKPLFAQRAAPAASWDQLIALSFDTGATDVQQVTIIDPQKRAMGVYHIDRSTGEIALKSVRNVHWDLLMEEFNSVSPSPRDIRSLSDRRR